MMASVAVVESPTERPVAVWIEDRDGTIVRGVAESVTERGIQVRLSGPPTFGQGAQVAIRISFDPASPTVATTARVSWVRSEGGEPECGLAWTESEAAVASWLKPRN
jgi:PilZ domain